MPLRSVTATCASPVVTLVMRKGTCASLLPRIEPFFCRWASWRTTWSRQSRASPSRSHVTVLPSSRTSKVRGSPSVKR